LQQWNVKPDAANDIEKERLLRRVSTLGVVKLFNAINVQQQSKHAMLAKRPEPEKPGNQCLFDLLFLLWLIVLMCIYRISKDFAIFISRFAIQRIVIFQESKGNIRHKE
jgi:hypothetical protein